MNFRLSKKLWFWNKSQSLLSSPLPPPEGENHCVNQRGLYKINTIDYLKGHKKSTELNQKVSKLNPFLKKNHIAKAAITQILQFFKLAINKQNNESHFPFWRGLGGGNLYIPLFLLVFLTFFSCKKDNPIIIQGNFTNGVFIANEGQFQAGNASVSFYSTAGEIQEKIYNTTNNQPLGDVLQSINIQADKTYLVINNSSKVEVVNTSDFDSISTIENLGSPRHLQIINDSKAYVSDLYSDAISIINLASVEKTGEISIGGPSEEMVLIGNELFVTRPSLFDNYSNQLFVINTDSDEIMDSITLGYNPSNIQLDKNNQLWVMCNGDKDIPDNMGGLYRINPNTKTVDLALPFTDKEMSFYPRLALNGDKDQLYFLKLDIYTLSIDATVLPSEPLIKAEGRDIYGLGIHPTTNQIFVGDSGNFVQKGTVTIHDETGMEISSFKAGVGVNGFYFN